MCPNKWGNEYPTSQKSNHPKNVQLCFLIRTYLRIGTNSVSQLSVSQSVIQSVIQCVYKVEVSRLQFTIGLGVGWTHWEWTVHVNTLYTVYTLNTMYTLYTSYCLVSQAVSLYTRERFRDYNLQIFDNKLKYYDIFIWIRLLNIKLNLLESEEVNEASFILVLIITPWTFIWDLDKSFHCHCWQSSPC